MRSFSKAVSIYEEYVSYFFVEVFSVARATKEKFILV